MKEAGALAAAAILAAWLVWNVWNLVRLTTGLRNDSWRRPMWWTRLLSISLFTALASWVRGASSGSLDIREACQITHRQPYDEAYWEAHSGEFQKIFPLRNKCNEHYDLVPVWVNPAIVISAVIALAALTVLVWFGTARLISSNRKVNQP